MNRGGGAIGPRAGTCAANLEEAVMTVIIYGDFNCPYSYLASQRADRLREAGMAVDWRAVEHDRGLPAGGLPSGNDRASWSRELAEVASLALPGEQVPAGPPTLISNTEAAVAAYAEAVSDGVADELLDRSLVALDGDPHGIEVALHHLAQGFGVDHELLSHGCLLSHLPHEASPRRTSVSN